MSRLSARFSPARKAWKKFTSTVQSNLRKLQGSRTMKKGGNLASKGEITASAMLEQRRRSRLRRKKRVKRRLLFNFLVKKKPAPVYIDNLFNEPVSVLEFGAEINNSTIKPRPCVKRTRHFELPGTSNPSDVISGTGNRVEVEHGGDNMLVQSRLVSPYMYGIDARAEEFITRFRAEMKNQEKLASD